MPEMTWDEALDVVVADTRGSGVDDDEFDSDAAVLYHVYCTVALEDVVRYDLETDDQTDRYVRNATAHMIFLGEYKDPTVDDLHELVRLLSVEGVVTLTKLQELWVYKICQGD